MNSWQQELASSVTSSEVLLTRLGLDATQVLGVDHTPAFSVRVPEPFITRMVPGDPHDPLLRQVLSVVDERILNPGFVTDPLDEFDSVLPGVLHKYRSRVLPDLSWWLCHQLSLLFPAPFSVSRTDTDLT